MGTPPSNLEDEAVMEKKTRLGRGLDALLGGIDSGADGTPNSVAQPEVPIERIDNNPFQARKNFDEDEIASMADSIRNSGVLQPLIVRKAGERYQLIAGERRLRAARLAGLTAVPIRVVEFNDQQVLEASLVENIQRTDLNPIEKAQGFKEYLERFHVTHDELARRLGQARVSITNLITLLELPPEIQDEIRRGQITLGHAKILKSLDRDRQLALCKEIIARGLSVHATEAFLRHSPTEQSTEDRGQRREDSGQEAAEPRQRVEMTAHVRGIENELRQKLATRVEIRLRAEDRGQFVLPFESNDDFERLLEVLRK
jgi:ParB family chromosome partitioning protein